MTLKKPKFKNKMA